MKVTVTQSDLQKSLNAVNRVTPTNPQIPILSHVMLSVNGGGLTIRGTDLDTNLYVPVGGETAEPGEATVRLQNLLKLVRKLDKAEPVEIGDVATGDDVPGGIKVRSGAFVADLTGLPADEFPGDVDFEGETQSLTARAGDVVDAYMRTKAFVSKEERRPTLNGILCEAKKDALRFVATNGHKMIVADLPADGDDADIIVPPDAFKVARYAFADDDELTFTWNDSHLRIQNADDDVIVTRLIDGPYPNYRQVIPADASIDICVQRQELLGAAERATTMASAQTHRMALNVNDDLTVVVSQFDTGESREKIEILRRENIAKDAGGNFEIGLSAKYVTDILSAMVADEINLRFTTAVRPVIFEASERDPDSDVTAFYLLMPLRLKD